MRKRRGKMKKILILVMLVCFMLTSAVAMAAEVASSDKPAATSFSERLKKLREESENPGLSAQKLANMPKVAVLYVNNAKTSYDDEIDQLLLGNLAKCIPSSKYQYIDGTPYLERLNKIGIVDLTTAERADIVEAFSGDDVDYVVFMEIEPFIRKDKLTFFTVGKEMTATLPLKVIDLLNNRYLYNGKFVEKATDSSMMGGIGNKSVSNKALMKINEQVASVLSVRLPAEKPIMAQIKK